MSGRGGKKSRVKIHAAKPDLPPFLQAMRQQIVENEDAERKERSLRKRKEMIDFGVRTRSKGSGHSSDDNEPTVVKLGDGDLTEEDYKRMKRDLDELDKLDQKLDEPELNMSNLFERRTESSKAGGPSSSSSSKAVVSEPKQSDNNKKLNYSSSEEE